MRLQLALDTLNGEEAIQFVSKVSKYIDIIEIGTPLALREGVRTIYEMKNRFPHHEVLADFKIVDGGKFEAALAFEAGADIVTVLALAADATVKATVEEASRAGRYIMADMLGVRDIANRAKELLAFGVDYICVHTASDLQESGHTPLQSLRQVSGIVEPRHIAVAGGVSFKLLTDVLNEKPAIVVVGKSITAAADPKSEARAWKAALKEQA